jgi:hypothetical protein
MEKDLEAKIDTLSRIYGEIRDIETDNEDLAQFLLDAERYTRKAVGLLRSLKRQQDFEATAQLKASL